MKPTYRPTAAARISIDESTHTAIIFDAINQPFMRIDLTNAADVVTAIEALRECGENSAAWILKVAQRKLEFRSKMPDLSNQEILEGK